MWQMVEENHSVKNSDKVSHIPGSCLAVLSSLSPVRVVCSKRCKTGVDRTSCIVPVMPRLNRIIPVVID